MSVIFPNKLPQKYLAIRVRLDKCHVAPVNHCSNTKSPKAENMLPIRLIPGRLRE